MQQRSSIKHMTGLAIVRHVVGRNLSSFHFIPTYACLAKVLGEKKIDLSCAMTGNR